jgi:hypothetical protein
MGVSLYVGCIDLKPGMQNSFPEMWGASNLVFIENCPLVGYYAASSGNLLPMFQDNLSHLQGSRIQKRSKGFLTLADGTNRLSRNVGKK